MNNTFDQDKFADKIKDVIEFVLEEKRAEAERQEEEKRKEAEWQENRFQNLLRAIDEEAPMAIANALKAAERSCQIGQMPRSYVARSFSLDLINTLPAAEGKSILTPQGQRLFAILEKAGLVAYPVFNGTDGYDYMDEDSKEAGDPTSFDIYVDIQRSPALQEALKEEIPAATETI